MSDLRKAELLSSPGTLVLVHNILFYRANGVSVYEALVEILEGEDKGLVRPTFSGLRFKEDYRGDGDENKSSTL